MTCKHVAVLLCIDITLEGHRVAFYPMKLGYASTIYKMQGAEVAHITIFLDIPGQRAAAYVAMSRVNKNGDYLFGGRCTKKHFIPNA